MLIAARGKYRGARVRGVSWFALALLVVVQLLGAAHFHPPVGAKTAAQSSSSAASPDLCPICLHYYHTPSGLASAPAFAHPLATLGGRTPTSRGLAPVEFESPLYGRAPPAVV
ncbi:MAG TPA: hypothetical protein VNF27_08920 [Candidatus Binataceae bacterium]|nr:hypothetical protein [Candidatus Binataceae bacterium]